MVARNQDLAWVWLRPEPLAKCPYLFQFASLREISSVQKHITLRQLESTRISGLRRMRVTYDDKSDLVWLLLPWSLERFKLKLCKGLVGLIQFRYLQPSLCYVHIVHLSRYHRQFLL